MSHEAGPARPSTLKTFVREKEEKAEGCALQLVGGLLIALGVYLLYLSVASRANQEAYGICGFIAVVFGLAMAYFGAYHHRKAEHVVWTLEAIERAGVVHRGALPGASEYTCPNCGHDEVGEFCGACGERVRTRCQQCGRRNSLASKFCSECGNPLAPTSASPMPIVCPVCQERNALTAQTCSACGNGLSQEPEREGAHPSERLYDVTVSHVPEGRREHLVNLLRQGGMLRQEAERQVSHTAVIVCNGGTTAEADHWSRALRSIGLEPRVRRK